MEQLQYTVIKRPNGNSIYNDILKTVESTDYVNSVKPINSKINHIVEEIRQQFSKRNIPPIKGYFSRRNTHPSPILADTHTSGFSELKTKVDLIKKYIKNLNA